MAYGKISQNTTKGQKTKYQKIPQYDMGELKLQKIS